MEGDWSPEEQQAQLNKSGSEGWELVAVLQDGKGLAFYFRREIVR